MYEAFYKVIQVITIIGFVTVLAEFLTNNPYVMWVSIVLAILTGILLGFAIVFELSGIKPRETHHD